MRESTTTEHISSYASLAALGTLIRQRDLFGPVRTHVKLERLALWQSGRL